MTTQYLNVEIVAERMHISAVSQVWFSFIVDEELTRTDEELTLGQFFCLVSVSLFQLSKCKECNAQHLTGWDGR